MLYSTSHRCGGIGVSKSVVTLNIGGASYEGWESVHVELSMENLSGSFALQLTDQSGGTANAIKPNDPCTVLINGQLVITGYVDKVTPSFDATSHKIMVTGRDKAGDLVDSSVIHKSGQWKNKKIDEIIKDVASPFGINVDNKTESKTLETFNLDQGATAFETIQKLAKRGNFLAVSDGKGGLLLTREATEMMGVPLIEGQNILAANCDYDASKKHSEYHVKGQKQGKDEDKVKKITQNKSMVTNDFVNRYRPLLIIHEGQADESAVKERARWEAKIRNSKATKAEITVQGWDSGAGLWGINRLTMVESNWLGIHDMMLITNVSFTLDENGELAVISLAQQGSYSKATGDKISKKPGKAGATQAKGNPYIGA
jgi:prophage tail gpP-like protein